MKAVNWYPQSMSAVEALHFSDWEKCLALEGELISESLTSSLRRVRVDGKHYYVKVYDLAGRHLRRFLGRSRIRAEWENLAYFQSHGVPTARLVAYGEERYPGLYRKGLMITEEIEAARDLVTLLQDENSPFQDRRWRKEVIRKLAAYVAILHGQHFIHGDLKWRNILVNPGAEPEVYLIDCPLGRQLPGWFCERGIIKDLACLDKVAKYQLSHRERLSFYHLYTGKMSLDVADKRRISKILRFFTGRE